MFKIICILGLIAVASAIEYYHSAPVYHQPAIIKHVEVEAPAKYQFSYAVHDDHTGDIHEQSESRDGDIVHGSYSLVDPDGHKRIVEYTADKHNGFNAVVHREPIGHQVQKIIAPVAKVIAAPAYHGYSHY